MNLSADHRYLAFQLEDKQIELFDRKVQKLFTHSSDGILLGYHFLQREAFFSFLSVSTTKVEFFELASGILRRKERFKITVGDYLYDFTSGVLVLVMANKQDFVVFYTKPFKSQKKFFKKTITIYEHLDLFEFRYNRNLMNEKKKQMPLSLNYIYRDLYLTYFFNGFLKIIDLESFQVKNVQVDTGNAHTVMIDNLIFILSETKTFAVDVKCPYPVEYMGIIPEATAYTPDNLFISSDSSCFECEIDLTAFLLDDPEYLFFMLRRSGSKPYIQETIKKTLNPRNEHILQYFASLDETVKELSISYDIDQTIAETIDEFQDQEAYVLTLAYVQHKQNSNQKIPEAIEEKLASLLRNDQIALHELHSRGIVSSIKPESYRDLLDLFYRQKEFGSMCSLLMEGDFAQELMIWVRYQPEINVDLDQITSWLENHPEFH